MADSPKLHARWPSLPITVDAYPQGRIQVQRIRLRLITKSQSRSLLFFAGETIFTNMSFDGVSKRFRRLETAEESFDRQVREGYNFEGLA